MLQILSESPQVVVPSAFILALIIGSFLNVVIYRLPVMIRRDWREQAAQILEEPAGDLPEGRFDLIMPPSRCPACQHPVSALQNIPVLSWVFLRGKCANCSVRISMRYPAVELCTAILTALVVIRFGFTAESLFAVIFTWFLIVIALIDYDTQLIPDLLSLPLLWIGLALSLFHPVTGSQVLFVAPKDAIVGALAGYLSLWSVYHVFRMLTGKEGMGYGDFKLLAAIGAWIGYQALPLVILLSAFVGAIVGMTLIALKRQSRETPMPFGPYLAAAGWVALLYGDEIVDLYFRLVLQTG